MASLQQESKGHWRIKFTAGYKSYSIRLGYCDRKTAQTALIFVEKLIAAQRLGAAPDGEVIGWMNRLDDKMYQRLVRVGLATPRESTRRTTLKQLIEKFAAIAPCKHTTAIFYAHTQRNLLSYFGDRPLNSITPAEADDFRAWLVQDQKLAIATVSRRIIACRTIWKKAIRWGMAKENPFTGVTAGQQTNETRKQFVSGETAHKLMEHCPNPQWRLIVACSRFAGLRVPSEIMVLRWRDINWQKRSVTVRSPKTEHHPGGAYRIIPLFPEIVTPLEDCRNRAAEGDEYVIAGRLRSSTNLRTQINRIAKRAGLALWPKPFHNMRASFQSELMRKYDLSTACRWLGNSPVVAARHYALSTDFDGDFRRAAGIAETGPNSGPFAAQIPALHIAATTGNQMPTVPENTAKQEVFRSPAEKRSQVQKGSLGDTGFEPVTSCVSCMRSNQLS